MIECTFAHVSEVRKKGEKRLWKSGITTWLKLLQQSKKHPDFTKRMWKNLRQEAIKCREALEKKNYYYFLKEFTNPLLWRSYPNFRGKILYLDTEMTGLNYEKDNITTIAAHDENECFTFIRGENLDEFPELFKKYSAICTFDGDKVDIPFIEKEFEIPAIFIHFDLFQMSRWLRLSGGLKQIEKRLNITRNLTQGVDGEMAIYLWNQYQKTKNRKYLNTLLAYNLEDTIYLPTILFEFYEHIRRYDKLPEKSLKKQEKLIPKPIKIPIKPSTEVIEELMHQKKRIVEI